MNPQRAARCLVLFLAGLLVVLLFYGRDIALFFRAPKPLVEKMGLFFHHDREKMQALGHKLEGDWILRPGELSLPPGKEGRFVARFMKKETSRPRVLLYTFRAPKGASLIASINDEQKKTVPLNGRRFILEGKPGERFTHVEITANAPPGDKPVVFLKGIDHFAYRTDARKITPFPVLLFILFFPLLCFLPAGGSRKDFIAALFLPLIMALLDLLFHLSSPTVTITFFVIICWFLYSDFLKRKKGFRWKGEYDAVLIMAFMLLALTMRWPGLVESVGHRLDPDAAGYLEIAREGKGLFQTSCDKAPYIREPLFIWTVRAAFLSGSRDDTAIRFLSMVLSVLMIPTVFLTGRRWFGRVPALLAALACSLNPYFVSMSVRGLRMELYIICVLVFLYSLEWLKEKDAWSGVRSGAAAGACVLARITSLSFTIPLTLYFGIRNKTRPLNLAIAIVVPFVMIAPHLVFNWRNTGDPMFSSNIHARFYRNREFAGQPGFPTKEEAAKDPYTGQSLSTLSYIFRLHSIPEVVSITSRGVFNIFGKYTLYGLLGGSKILFLFYVFGFLATLFSRRWEWVLAALILEAPSAFLAGQGLDWRLTFHAAPLLYLFTGNGIVILFGLIKKRLFRRKEN